MKKYVYSFGAGTAGIVGTVAGGVPLIVLRVVVVRGAGAGGVCASWA